VTTTDTMKIFLALLLLGAASAFVERDEWTSFKGKHGKSYANPIEEFYRMKVYADNKAFVDQHMKEYAAGKHTFTVALNKFADLTNDEFNQLYKGLIMGSTRPHGTHKVTNVALPDTVDWRTSDMVTPVKDQAQCGSCWAFSATGGLEGQWKKSGRSLASFSEQQLVDCSGSEGNQGCNGGWMDSAFQYIEDVGGIQLEGTYPYQARNHACRADSSKFVGKVSGYTDVASKDENALQQAVATVGPISVAIDASHTSFQLYSSGIYDEGRCSQTRLDHGVLAVGYGDGYWLVKNSWGTSWGMSGYLKMTRDGSNQCGIATQASYPAVPSPP